MARAVREANLVSKDARRKLAPRRKPYWRLIEPGRHLGYYRGSRSASWIVRVFQGSGKYLEHTLGLADDNSAPDGVAILDFKQALSAAQAWAQLNHPTTRGVHIGPYTIERAAEDYMVWFKDNRKSTTETQHTIDAFILPALGKTELSRLSTQDIRRWHSEIANRQPRLRAKGDGKAFRSVDLKDPEIKRQRQSTANRNLTVLKALLNYAWREGKAQSDSAWRKVTPFRQVDRARVRYLSKEECGRLIGGSETAFRNLVQGALFTGCRYGELTRLTAADLNAETGTLLVRWSKAGLSRQVILTELGQAFFQRQVQDKSPHALIFSKSDGSSWNKSHQVRPLADACKAAHIESPMSFHALRHTYASHLVMAGIPLLVVAKNLGHSDTRMVERHYAHLCPDYTANAIRRSAPELGVAA